MSIEGQGHFFTIYFPGYVCFVLYKAKISGERLQDHWSSGLGLLKCKRMSRSYLLWGCSVTNYAKKQFLKDGVRRVGFTTKSTKLETSLPFKFWI